MRNIREVHRIDRERKREKDRGAAMDRTVKE